MRLWVEPAGGEWKSTDVEQKMVKLIYPYRRFWNRDVGLITSCQVEKKTLLILRQLSAKLAGGDFPDSRPLDVFCFYAFEMLNICLKKTGNPIWNFKSAFEVCLQNKLWKKAFCDKL